MLTEKLLGKINCYKFVKSYEFQPAKWEKNFFFFEPTNILFNTVPNWYTIIIWDPTSMCRDHLLVVI